MSPARALLPFHHAYAGGGGSQTGDGLASDSLLQIPTRLAWRNGALYWSEADTGGTRRVVRKYDPYTSVVGGSWRAQHMFYQHPVVVLKDNITMLLHTGPPATTCTTQVVTILGQLSNAAVASDDVNPSTVLLGSPLGGVGHVSGAPCGKEAAAEASMWMGHLTWVPAVDAAVWIMLHVCSWPSASRTRCTWLTRAVM
jgi:hypothetical protein